MNFKVIKTIILLSILFSVAATDLMAQQETSSTEKQKKSSPFLITNQLPHLTKLLIKQWDNPTLNLSEAQKSKLLIVRKETIGAVKALGPKISDLEAQVVEGIFAQKTPGELKSLVSNIAKLKADASMVHLQCIYRTSQILDAQQLDLLNAL